MSIIKMPLKERGGMPMVNSVSGVNSATSSNAINPTKDAEKIKKQEEEKLAKEAKTKSTDKTDKETKTDKTNTDKTEKSSYAFDRVTIQNKVKEYIEKLKKEHDYPYVQSELTKYLDLFKVDDFMKKYPNITTDADFRTIMYNETIKYL